MKTTKRLIALLLVCLLALSSASCQLFLPAEVKFNQFVESLPFSLLSSDSMDMNFVLADPEKAGFSLELLELPVATKEDYEESEAGISELLKMLRRIDRSRLSEEQQLTYDVIADYFERSLLLMPYYYQNNNYLGSFLGFQAQLPLLLAEFHFERQNDLDSYFHILETAEETFLQYAGIERERQENGCGMSQTILDKIIGQCENMTADSEPFLIELINERIDALNFLSAEEKAAAKEKNETLLKNDFLNAYRSLGEELSKMEGSSEDLGLHSQPQGKEYYEALLQANTGVDFTVKEVKSYFNGKLQNISSRFVELYTQNPNLFEEMGDGPVYCDFASAEETIDYLEEQVKRDFPALGTLNYAVNQVPDAMKDNFSPAAYLTSRIDTPLSQNEVIYLNGDYDPSLFPTLAHEGYPGHMYQTVYFKSLQKPLARYLMSYGGYDEGWATYVEHNSYRYAPGDQTLLEAWELNSELGECYTALMDIGVHYEGWDRDDFHEVYQSLSDGVTREMSDEFYDLILETPTNYLRYYLMGFLLQDLYDEAQEALGSDFSSVDFHEVILSTGPAPYDILKQQVEAYIDRVQNPAAQSAEAA